MGHDAHFSWFHFVPVLRDYPQHVVSFALIGMFLMAATLLARLALAGQKNALVPEARMTFVGFFDIAVESIHKMAESVLGKDAGKYMPIVGTLFLYIFTCNLFGLIPGFSPPTDNVNTTLACGLFVFLYYNYRGVREGGLHYLKHFLGPVWYMAWMILPIEIISHSVRPFTLALRLKGNMMGDHTVLSVFTDMFGYGVPVAVYFLGLLVCLIQAFIFVMLTMVYISMAKDSEHH